MVTASRFLICPPPSTEKQFEYLDNQVSGLGCCDPMPVTHPVIPHTKILGPVQPSFIEMLVSCFPRVVFIVKSHPMTAVLNPRCAFPFCSFLSPREPKPLSSTMSRCILVHCVVLLPLLACCLFSPSPLDVFAPLCTTIRPITSQPRLVIHCRCSLSTQLSCRTIVCCRQT